MTACTPEEAGTKLCPLARTFGSATADPHCRGDECMAWRWAPLLAGTPEHRTAIRKLAEETGEKPPYPKAARAVAEDPEAHGITANRGYCGVGGAVERERKQETEGDDDA